MAGYGGFAAPAFTVPGTDRPPREQCFFLRSPTLGVQLVVEGGRVDPGTRAVTARPTPQPQDNQLWYEDMATGTLRSRLNTLCLDLKDCTPGFQLVRSPGSPVPQALRLGQQNDGGGPQFSAVAHTAWGNIPGKAKGNNCWYAYSGQEHLTSDFSWIVASGVTQVPNGGMPPIGALAAGHLTDGSGAQYAAIARTSHGTIPGRAQGNICQYPYGGREHVTSEFNWLIAEQAHTILTPFMPGNLNQQWIRNGDRIQSRQDPNKVLQMSGRAVGSTLTPWSNTGTAEQLWSFPSPGAGVGMAQPMGQPVPAFTAPVPHPVQPHSQPTARFVLRSQLHGKVLDVKANNKSPGTKVILYPRKQPAGDNQLWYMDGEGVIRSQLTNFAFQPSGHGIWLQPYQGQANQKWTLVGNKITQRADPNRCLEVQGANQANGTLVVQAAYKGAARQHWVADYV